eukprot:5192603-Amphidinium_carterae.1
MPEFAGLPPSPSLAGASHVPSAPTASVPPGLPGPCPSAAPSSAVHRRGGQPPPAPVLRITFSEAANEPLVFKQWLRRLAAWQRR